MQPLYAEDPSSQTVGAFNTSLWQYQPKIATDLSGYADGGVAPLVSSFLRSDISQQLANSLISQTSQRRVASAPSSLTLSRATGSLQDPLRALVQAPAHRYPPTPLQDPPAAVPRTKAYICPLYSCGRFYRERWFLMEHIYSHAAHKPYQCERCFKQFSRADHFSQHRQRHARADSGDHQAILDLEREDEDEVMLMGEKCEVEVHGEVEDVAGGKGELRGLGIVCVYPWNPAGETMILNPTDNLPYSGVSSKHPEHDSMAHWRAHPDRGLFSTSRNAPPVERWPQDLESTWETPKNYESLERGASPVNTQFALACMQSSDGDGLFPASDSGGALGRHGIATPLQFHRSMAAAMRRTSADGPEEVDFAKSSSRYHPFENTYAPPVEALLTHPVNQNDSRPPRTASSTKKRLNAESTNHESNRDRHHDVRSQKRRKKQASPSLSRPSEQPVDSTLDANDTEQLRSQDSSMYSILDRPSTDATVRYASSMDNTVSSFPATGGRSFGEECVENDGKRIDLISPRHLGALNDNQQAIHPGLNQAPVPANSRRGSSDTSRLNLASSFSQAHESGNLVTSLMTMSEIISCLGARGCQNITSQLNLTSCSQYPISNGGFGDVFRGSLNDGSLVAIKTMRLNVGCDSSNRKCLKHAALELYTWSKCQHRNVQRLLGLVEFRGQIGMVSMWETHGNLSEYIRLQPKVDRCQLSAQVAEGLAYLHESGIVHGDLKATNVLVSKIGEPLLADFGNSTLEEYTLKFTSTSAKYSVSIRWAAPDVLEGNVTHSALADVYALGMTILETITSELPWSGKADAAVMAAVMIRKAHPERPSSPLLEASQHGDLVWSMLRDCWAYKPEDRPSAADVQGIMQGITHTA